MADEPQLGSKILVVDDDPNVVELVRLYLERDGHQVLIANDGVAGLEMAREELPDLIVLDLMMPRMDGMEVCRTLRAESSVPVVMLTAMVEEDDRLAGLDLGADDYVTKPFSPRELAARVRAVLRRTARDRDNPGPELLESGPFAVDLRQRTVSVAGTPVTLTPTEFRLIPPIPHSVRQVLPPSFATDAIARARGRGDSAAPRVRRGAPRCGSRRESRRCAPALPRRTRGSG